MDTERIFAAISDEELLGETQRRGLVLGAAATEAVEASDVLTRLSPERREYADKLIAAMSEKFGVRTADFSLVETSAESGEKLVTAVYAGKGLDLGNRVKNYDPNRSWNGIFDEKADENFIVTVDGRAVDTRAGLTEVVYYAMVAGAKKCGATLPDSQQMAEEYRDHWTWTWLTGEIPNRSLMPFARVGGGEVERYWRDRNSDDRCMRFRPAAVIEQVS